MKIHFLILFLLVLGVSEIHSELIEIKQDNGIPQGHSYISRRNNWEESAAFRISAPCYVRKIKIYFMGGASSRDTIFVCGDPAAGNMYPTLYVLQNNSLIPPIVFNYDGVEGWKEFDISSLNLRLSGFEAIAIQHRMKSTGPWFAYDSDGRTTGRNSWLTDPITPNAQFYNIKGTIYEFPNGDFLVRLYVEYEFPDGEISASPPAPSLLNINSVANVSFGGNPAVADWNNDGWDDILAGGYFYENNKDGTFSNKSSQFGIPSGGYSWGDFDNDGKIDLFVGRGWTNDKFYKNTGSGFLDVTNDLDFVNDYPTETPVWFDYDVDGFLDLFIANRRSESGGQETYYPNQLWKNTGNANFVNVTTSSGISAGEPYPYYDLYGSSAVDYNNDNYPDLFVATYRLAPDLLYRNDKTGRFTEVGAQTGVRGVPTASPSYFGHGMGCHWGDFNNDGYIDLCVGNLAHLDERGIYSNSSLIFRNGGPPDFTFTEVGKQMGLRFHEGNAGAIWLDLDLDGYLDLWHGKYAGGVGSFYLNQGPPDYKLKDVTWELGAVVQNPWAAVFSDLDNDGDLDVIMNGIIFRNDIERKGNWVAFRVQGNPSEKVNMDGYGTKIYVYCGNKMFFRELSGSASGTHATQNTNELHFGLGNCEDIDSIRVIYPNSKIFTFNNVVVNARYFIPYGRAPELRILSTPALISPKNYEVNVSASPLFKWAKVGEAVRYKLQVSKNADFSADVIEVSNISSTQFTGFELESEKMYYWRVKAFADNMGSQWSSVWSFYTDIPTPAKPYLIEPADKSENLPILPTFIWSSSSLPLNYGSRLRYRLQIAEDSDFESVVMDISEIRDTFYILKESLKVSTEYYWRITAMNYDKSSGFSTVFSFKTITVPRIPALISPANNEINVILKPFLRWENVPYADYYHLQVATDNNFENIYFEKDSINVNLYKLTKGLEPFTSYFWRVRGSNIAGFGEWSDVWTFRTQEASNVIDYSSSAELSCSLNYLPNPFTEALNLCLDVFQRGSIRVSVANILGEEIEEIYAGELEVGSYSFIWFPKNISEGVYWIKVEGKFRSKFYKVVYFK